MHTVPDPLYIQNQALIWLGVLVAVVTGGINAYHSLKALWLSTANKERLDSQSSTLKMVLRDTSPTSAAGSQTVNAPAAQTVNVSDAPADTPAPPAIDPVALQALKDELTAHAESLKQSISSTPLTATLMGQITAGDLAAAHAEIAKAQEVPVPAPTEAAQPFPAPAGVIAPPPAV